MASAASTTAGKPRVSIIPTAIDIIFTPYTTGDRQLRLINCFFGLRLKNLISFSSKQNMSHMGS
jgi:hypothetical protein